MINLTALPPKIFWDQIRLYRQPEALFGELGTTPDQQLIELELAYKSLIKIFHPDRYATQPGEQYYVTEITKQLNELKRRALVKIRTRVYGDLRVGDYQSVIKTPNHELFVCDLLVEGSLADIYKGYYLDPADLVQPVKQVVIKMIADPFNNRLVEHEIMFYQTLSHFCFPTYLENFATSDGRRAIVLGYLEGGYDLIELVQRYRQQYGGPGLPQEHFVWILDRFLAALGLLHDNKILHGNIQPDNLMVQPQNHNGVLIDFLHCRILPAPDDVFTPVNPKYCAPEVLTRHFKPHPVSDIYALGCCMVEMLGGSNGSLDDSIALDPALRRLLQKMILADPAQRAADAWALGDELKTLRHKIYGAKPNFIPLIIGGSDGRR